MFALYYSAEDKKIRALNGSGCAPAQATLEGVRQDLGLVEGESGTIPMSSVHAVITPGAAAGWVDVVEKFGNKTLSLKQILEPAIELAEQGFPVSELSSLFVSNAILPDGNTFGLTTLMVTVARCRATTAKTIPQLC